MTTTDSAKTTDSAGGAGSAGTAGGASAEGRQREQTFFHDPATDRLLGVVFNLAAELQVMRERVRVLEHTLASRGVIEPGALELVDAGAAIEAELAADRRDFVRHLLDPVLGLAATRNDAVDAATHGVARAAGAAGTGARP